MQQLTKSLGSFTWAISLFGLQQMTNALSRSPQGGMDGDAGASLDALTTASIDQCGTAVRETFEVGDKMQRDIIDLMFRLVPMGGGESNAEPCSCTNPMDAVRRGPGMARSAAGTAKPSPAPEEELGWGPVPPVA